MMRQKYSGNLPSIDKFYNSPYEQINGRFLAMDGRGKLKIID
jgi:hypothetical protein